MADSQSRRRSLVATVEALKSAQKPGNGVPAYLRWVNRPLGRWAAAVAHNARMTPNSVTAVSMALSVGGMMMIVVGGRSYLGAAAAAILLLAGYSLDSADGQLARLRGSGSPAGEWLDHVVDAIRQPSVHLALGAFFLIRGDGPNIAMVAIAGCFMVVSSSWFFAQILAEKLTAPPAQSSVVSSQQPWLSIAKLPYDPGFLYLGITLLPVTQLFIVFYSFLLVLHATLAATSLVRKYRLLSR